MQFWLYPFHLGRRRNTWSHFLDSASMGYGTDLRISSLQKRVTFKVLLGGSLRYALTYHPLLSQSGSESDEPTRSNTKAKAISLANLTPSKQRSPRLHTFTRPPTSLKGRGTRRLKSRIAVLCSMMSLHRKRRSRLRLLRSRESGRAESCGLVLRRVLGRVILRVLRRLRGRLRCVHYSRSFLRFTDL